MPTDYDPRLLMFSAESSEVIVVWRMTTNRTLDVSCVQKLKERGSAFFFFLTEVLSSILMVTL